MNMKQVLLMLAFAVGVPVWAETIEDSYCELAERLFSDEALYSNRFLLKESAYVDFFKHFPKGKACTPKLAEFVSNRIFSYDLWALTNLEFSVKWKERNLWHERGELFSWLIHCLPDSVKDADFCRRLALSIARASKMDLPEGVFYGSRSVLIVDPPDMSPEEKKQKQEQTKRRLEKWDREEKICLQIGEWNHGCEMYKARLIGACGKILNKLSSTMDKEKFSALTNDIVRISNADNITQTALFRDLNERMLRENETCIRRDNE